MTPQLPDRPANADRGYGPDEASAGDDPPSSGRLMALLRERERALLRYVCDMD